MNRSYFTGNDIKTQKELFSHYVVQEKDPKRSKIRMKLT